MKHKKEIKKAFKILKAYKNGQSIVRSTMLGCIIYNIDGVKLDVYQIHQHLGHLSVYEPEKQTASGCKIALCEYPNGAVRMPEDHTMD